MVNVEWSGRYPNLCDGSWTIKINDIDYTKHIPESKRSSPMYTFGRYKRWYMGDDWMIEWDNYKDGLKERIWIRENEDWLNKITDDANIKREIFKAFQKEDWRYESCGGCS